MLFSMVSVMLVILFWIMANGSTSLEVGQTFPNLVLPDQHGNLHQLRKNTRWVVITFDKRTGVLARRWLREKPQDFFQLWQITLVAEISRMPKRLGEQQIMPKIKEFPRRVLLAEDPDICENFPHKMGCVTVMELSPEGRINHIFFPDSSGDLEAILGH